MNSSYFLILFFMNKSVEGSTQKINTLHQQFSRYGTNAKEWMKKCVLLLPEIARNEVWKKKRFDSIYEYAAKLAGMSKNTVDEGLRILRQVDDKPALRAVIEEKGINRVRPILAVVNSENESFWAEKAMEMSKNTLEVYVKEFRTRTDSQSVNLQNQQIFEEKITITMELDPEVAEELRKYDDLNTLMKELLALKKAKLEAEKPEIKEDASRHIPNPTQRFITERSQGKCEYPGCTKVAYRDHHADRYAMYKTHDPDRIFDLCKSHEDLCHQGLIANEEMTIKHWKIREKHDENDPSYDEVDKIVKKFRRK